MSQNNKIRTGQIAEEAWTSWNPSWTNLTVGSGTVVAKYIKIGKTVHFRISFTLAADSSIGASTPTFTLPVNAASYASTPVNIGFLRVRDLAPANYEGFVLLTTATTAQVVTLAVTGSVVTAAGITTTSPMTWATGDYFVGTGTYESA